MCNGLESNKKIFEKNCQKKHFCQRNSMNKTNSDKNFFSGNFSKFRNFLKFQIWIFSEGCVKNNVFHV